MTHKNRKVWMFGLVVGLAATLVLPTVVLAAGGPPDGRGTGATQNAYVASGELDAEEQAALVEFLLDEHKALATYESVMAEFGAVQPFVSIARAEEQHIAALENVFARYGVALPTIPAFDIPDFDTPEDACAAGAQAEIDNAALYDRLMSTIDNADVLRVAENLRAASLNSHLPTFEACADGDYEAGEVLGSMIQQRGTTTSVQGQGLGQGMTNATPRGRAVIGRGQMNSSMGLGTQLRTVDPECPAYQEGTYRGR